MNSRLIVGNIKMNLLTVRDRDGYLQDMRNRLRNTVTRGVDVVLCPPDIHLEVFATILEKQPISLGVQNVFWERKGAYTGETSPVMVRSLGAQYAIVGHSERRSYLGETDEMVAKKATSACEEGMNVILCVGESIEEHNKGLSEERVLKQLTRSLEHFPKGKIGNLTIAYEPVWSIGTGQTPESAEILSMHTVIRDTVGGIFGSGAGSYVRVLYGGSVDSKNIERVCIDVDMDGVLVGGASLHPDEFIRIIEKLRG